ncbi:hypothetical protein GQ42DRAFT_163816 [Ramicandelaber brevisporus]|nr:hypothetical protein GQ42DRAFT_163816 [Ramicandelaber brevisporus]
MPLEEYENVALSAPAEYRKVKGVLKLTDRRLLWTPDEAAVAQSVPPLPTEISIVFGSIRTQFATKPDAAKSILKVELHQIGNAAAVSHSFTFIAGGEGLAREQRDSFKNELALILQTQKTPESASGAAAVVTQPKGGTKTDVSNKEPAISHRELELRASLLSKDPELARLHRELVGAGILTEEQFWRVRRSAIKDHAIEITQVKGCESDLPDNIPMENMVDGNVSYTITRDKALDIFRLYPKIHHVFLQTVPHLLSEKQFWLRFVASKLFKRMRSGNANNSGSGSSSGVRLWAEGTGENDDIFDALLEEENSIVKNARQVKTENLKRTLDLSATANQLSIETGNAPDRTMKPGTDSNSISLIRRFNLHSEHVLNTLGIHTSNDQPNSNTHNDELVEETILDELISTNVPEPIPLKIVDQRHYFNGQNTTSLLSRRNQSTSVNSRMTTEELYQLTVNECNQMNNFRPQLSEPLFDGHSARKTLDTHTTTIRTKLDMAGSSSGDIFSQDSTSSLPPALMDQVTGCNASGVELLRHLWASLAPPVTSAKLSRASQIIAAMTQVEQKIEQAITAGNQQQPPAGDIVRSLLGPLVTAMTAGKERNGSLTSRVSQGR